jgi:hypothetical protein
MIGGVARRDGVVTLIAFIGLLSAAGAAPLVVESLFPSARQDPWRVWSICGAFVLPYFIVLALGGASPKWAARLGAVNGCLVLLGAVPLTVVLGLLGAWAYRPSQYLCLVLAIPVNALLVQRSLMKRQPK